MNIGFIGCGNMGQSMVGGIVSSDAADSKNVMVCDHHDEKLNLVKEKYGVLVSKDSKEIAKFSDVLILAVKPNAYENTIKNIKDDVKSSVIIVSIGAGISIDFIEKRFERKIKVVRVMPNTPALIGEAMSAICPNAEVKKEELDSVIKIFESFGKAEVVPEKLMSVVTAVSGSSPAFVYMFIEALADGAVMYGMPRDKAYKFAAQSVLGSAKMVLETGKHPGILKDDVCSPSGTTIDAVYSLEKNNFRGTVMDAVKVCTEKALKMSGDK